MWKLSLLLLIVLPPLAIVLNYDVVSSVLIIMWTMLVIPVCILQAIDALRQNKRNQLKGKLLLRVFVGMFGLLSLIIGTSIALWCLYNLFVKRLPEYSGPTDAIGFLVSGFGTGPTLLVFGWHCMTLAWNPFVGNEGEDGQMKQQEETST